MFDIYVGDTPLTTFVLLFSLVLVLPLQLLLCFKVRSLPVRLIPALLFLAGAAVLFLTGLAFTGFERLVFILLALLLLLPLSACGAAWLIWALIHSRRS